MDGLGSINWWGFTPALDLLNGLDVCVTHTNECSDVSKGELHILMIGAGDCRHIFKTLAHLYRHSARKLHFYVMESSMELYARHMLFMNIIREPPHKFGLQDKTELFLELYGNSLVRQQSMEYVQQVAPEFIKMVTNEDYLKKTFSMIDLSHLKFKERDILEGIFKFWRTATFSQFDICKCWELRLRQYLGVRFDAIPNVFDWDFSMKLCEKQCSIIGGRNYSRWRHKGIAYELREGTYDVPNRTLASGMVFKHEGERLARRGYWGDIIVSPYITFGIESEEKSFFKKSNNMYTQTSEDVAQYNVLSMMHEVAYRSHYKPATDTQSDKKEPVSNSNGSNQSDIEGAERKCNSSDENEVKNNEVSCDYKESEVKNLDTHTEGSVENKENVVKNNGANNEVSCDNKEGEVKNNGTLTEESSVHNVLDDIKEKANEDILSHDLMTEENVKIYFLSLNSTAELIKKSKYHHLFNVVYISNSQAHILTQDLADATFADGASVIMDTAKYILELKTEQCSEYVKKIVAIGETIGCKVIGNVDDKNDNFVKFVYNRTDDSVS